MTTIKIALTNLGLYNEGELTYKWVTLPISEEEIQEVKSEIGVDGVNYEEMFISDFEAPFHINEYDSISKLNEVAETLANTCEVNLEGEYLDDILSDIKSFAADLDMYEIVEDYYTLEEISELDLYPKDNNGRVDMNAMIYFTAQLTGLTEVVEFDGYGNLREVSLSDLENLHTEVITEFYKMN